MRVVVALEGIIGERDGGDILAVGWWRLRPLKQLTFKKEREWIVEKEKSGDAGDRTRCLSHAKRTGGFTVDLYCHLK